MVSRYLGKKWDAKEVRRMGLAALLTVRMLFHIVVVENKELYRRGRRVEVEMEIRIEDGKR